MGAPGDPDVDEVVRRELRLLDPAVRRSPAEVDILLERGFREFGSSGTVWDRRSILDLLADEDASPAQVEDIVATRPTLRGRVAGGGFTLRLPQIPA